MTRHTAREARAERQNPPDTMPAPDLPDTVTKAAEITGYRAATGRAAAAYQWAMGAAVRGLLEAHHASGGHPTAELAAAWQVYRQRVDTATAVYLRKITDAYTTAVALGGGR